MKRFSSQEAFKNTSWSLHILITFLKLFKMTSKIFGPRLLYSRNTMWDFEFKFVEMCWIHLVEPSGKRLFQIFIDVLIDKSDLLIVWKSCHNRPSLYLIIVSKWNENKISRQTRLGLLCQLNSYTHFHESKSGKILKEWIGNDKRTYILLQVYRHFVEVVYHNTIPRGKI